MKNISIFISTAVIIWLSMLIFFWYACPVEYKGQAIPQENILDELLKELENVN